MKAILVIDMPTSCRECPCGDWNICSAIVKTHTNKMSEQREAWCPLKPMPERVVENVWNKDWIAGWNAYYDTLTDFEDDPLKKELEK